MIRTAAHLIFLDRVKPYGRNTQVFQVIKMTGNSFQIAAMAGIRIFAVNRYIFEIIISGVSICKPIRCYEVQDIRCVKT